MGETTNEIRTARIDPLNPSATADELWRELSATNRPVEPHTVGRFGRLCRFGVDDSTGKLELHEHDIDTFRDRLTRKLFPVKASYADGQWVLPDEIKQTRVPNEAIQALLKRPLDVLDEIAPVPRVDRVVDVPVFAPDGTLVETPGHHAAARTYYKGSPMQGLTEHWDDPLARSADVEAARWLIMDELLGDFPFADEGSRAHALAMVVEQFARGMIAGPAPAYVVIAAEQGTGKSLLAQVCLYPSCGAVDLTPEPEQHPQDFQKRLLSELIRGPQAIVFDNVTRPLENSALAAMITTGKYADRVLGKSQILSFPIRHTTVFTMNNPEIGPDMRRRVIPIYLNAGVERPWERVGPASGAAWRHPDLLEWTADNRDELVRAAITLIKNYQDGWTEVDHAGGEYVRRATSPRLVGSFPSWSKVIGGVVAAAGVRGFGSNVDRLYEEQSEDDSDEAAFLEQWPAGERMTATEVLEWVTGVFGAVDPPNGFRNRWGKIDTQSVGTGLRQMRGRVRGGRYLENDRSVRPTQWYVVEAAV